MRKKIKFGEKNNLSCVRKNSKLCEKKISSCEKKKKFKFHNLDDLGLAILANFSNLAISLLSFAYLLQSLTIVCYLLTIFGYLSLSHCYILAIRSI